MTEIIPHDKIDAKKWNQCIERSSTPSVFGLYESICCACDNWYGIVCDNYSAVLALPVKKKMGVTYSWHPQFMGPIGLYVQNNLDGFKKEVLHLVKKSSWWIKLYVWQELDVNCEKRVFQFLDLNNTIDQVRSGYNSNTSRNIKKAQKLGLKVEEANDIQFLIENFKHYVGNQVENINNESYQLLNKLMQHWVDKKLGHIRAVFSGEDLAAIGYFLTWNGSKIYYKGVVTDIGRSIGAMHYLIDSEISSAMETCKIFDFGGSNVESVARFYKGFGGLDREYYYLNHRRI